MKKTTLLPCLLLASLAAGLSSVSAQKAVPVPGPDDPATPVPTAPVPPPAAPPAAAAPAVPGQAAAIEAPAMLRASQFLSPDLAASPLHRVREMIPTDGYLAHYTVDTDFGSFEVTGTTQLRRCVQEIQAIAKLNAVSRSDIFADGLRRSLEQPIDAAKNVVTHPVDTVKGLPSTVGHFFKKIGNSVSTASSNIKKRSAETGGAGSGEAAVKGMAKAGKGIIGFDKAKLECARQLGVDPYTDNPRLQDEMEKIAWVFWSGGLPLRIGGMATGAGLAIGATQFAGLPNDIYEVTPDELMLRDNKAMEALQVPAAERNSFNTNAALSVSLRHSILTSIATLEGAKGRAAVVGLAADCEDRQQARFLDETLRLLARRQAEGAPAVKEIKLMGRIPAAVDASGTLVLALPVDYVSWSVEVSEFVSREDLTGLKPHVFHTGGTSPLALQELTRAGWTLHRL